MRKNKRIVSIVGARPQFIKASVLSRSLKKAGMTEIMVHTGQHYDPAMSDIFFNDLQIAKPAYHLGIGSASHGEQTGRMLMEIEKVLQNEKPDCAVVFGDTNSTLAGALAAAKLHIPLAHVEAGLRSFNKNMPEEINRLLSDHLAALLFCPTTTAIENLRREGLANPPGPSNRTGQRGGKPIPLICHTGDLMYDLAMEVSATIDQAAILAKFSLPAKAFILATIHRAENTDDPVNLENIILAMADLAKSGIPVFFPIHPRTRKSWRAITHGGHPLPPLFAIHDPVSYPEMIALENAARVIITDSGGVQKEGYFFKTPCLIPRQESEWTELIDAKWNTLCMPRRKDIFKKALALYNFPGQRRWRNFFGNGDAAERMSGIIKNY
jgi:UDP-N-acetylglucosamine 2-epimerase